MRSHTRLCETHRLASASRSAALTGLRRRRRIALANTDFIQELSRALDRVSRHDADRPFALPLQSRSRLPPGVRQTRQTSRKKPLRRPSDSGRGGNGAPGAIRTPDPQIRSLMLYPAELRVRGEAPLRASARGRNPLFQLYDRLTGRLAANGVQRTDFGGSRSGIDRCDTAMEAARANSAPAGHR